MYKINMNENYWPQFYKKDEAPNVPSSFAVDIAKFIRSEKNIVDLGCGNGRDSYFLALNKNVDSIVGIDVNNKPIDGHKSSFIQKHWKDVDFNEFDVVYSRFFLHTIPNDELAELIDKCSESKSKYFIAEARSLGDVPEIYTDHERNFIDGNALSRFLKARGYDILYYEKGHGLAPYKNEDPLIVRIVAKKP